MFTFLPDEKNCEKYIPEAEVYVKYPSNLSEFISQKKRTAKGHETLGRYVNIKKIPRMKSLKNEIFESKWILERKLGEKVHSMAYPFGGFSDDIKMLAKEAG